MTTTKSAGLPSVETHLHVHVRVVLAAQKYGYETRFYHNITLEWLYLWVELNWHWRGDYIIIQGTSRWQGFYQERTRVAQCGRRKHDNACFDVWNIIEQDYSSSIGWITIDLSTVLSSDIVNTTQSKVHVRRQAQVHVRVAARPVLIESADCTPSPDQQTTVVPRGQGSTATRTPMYPWCTNRARLQKLRYRYRNEKK